jgi:uncharacterized membrane protein
MDETPLSPQPEHERRLPVRDRAEQRWRLLSIASWLIATIVALVVVFGLPAHLDREIRLFSGWNAGVITLLGFLWTFLLSTDAEQTRRRAAAEDPGRVVVFALSLLVSTISVLAATVLLGQVHRLAAGQEIRLVVGLGVLTVASGWVFMHTAFTLRYAHIFYSEGGLEYTGGAPDDLDFAYFAFTIGMTFQTSDIQVSSKKMRRTVLVHAMLSFVFNTVIMALAINLLFNNL